MASLPTKYYPGLSKRGSESVEGANERPWKRQFQMLDIDWLKDDIADIRAGILEIEKHLRDSPAPLPLLAVSDCTGLVSFTGLALLGCPEPEPNSCAVNLVAQLYIGSPTIDFLPCLYGSLRYFNSCDRIIFSRGPSELYLIRGTIAQVPSNGFNLPFSPPDCDFVGDIHSIIPLGRAPQSGVEPRTDAINHQITLHITGLALNPNVDHRTFTVDVNVGISSYKNARDGGGVNVLQPLAPFLCIIPKAPNGPKGSIQGKLNVPSNRSFVSVIGILTDVTFIHDDRHQGIERFHVTIQEIVSLGHASNSDVLPNPHYC